MTYWTCRGERAFIMLVVRKKQLFGAICTLFEFSIGYMMSMLNFSLLGQTLDLLLLKHYCEIQCLKQLIKCFVLLHCFEYISITSTYYVIHLGLFKSPGS